MGGGKQPHGPPRATEQQGGDSSRMPPHNEWEQRGPSSLQSTSIMELGWQRASRGGGEGGTDRGDFPNAPQGAECQK